MIFSTLIFLQIQLRVGTEIAAAPVTLLISSGSEVVQDVPVFNFNAQIKIHILSLPGHFFSLYVNPPNGSH